MVIPYLMLMGMFLHAWCYIFFICADVGAKIYEAGRDRSVLVVREIIEWHGL